MILRRIREATNAVLREKPDLLIIIDSPDFTHRVARRVRKANPAIPIIDYVSPTVWAWRPGRARAMTAYIDHVLAVLPFEPSELQTLGGPPCTYVGHPLIEQLDVLRPNEQERQRRENSPPLVVVLPGSRKAEIRHHMSVFGATLRALASRGMSFEAVLPTLPHLEHMVRAEAASWGVSVRIITGEDAKRASFRSARAALAKSGTVTLELALAGVPMVTAYKGGAVEAWIARRVVRVPSVILANLVLGENAIPEFLQEDCRPEKLAPALADMIKDTPQRRLQADALARVEAIMANGAERPSARAADVVMTVLDSDLRARR